LSISFSGSGEWTVLGLMSGTSLDGLDAARVRFEREADELRDWELIEYGEEPFPEPLRLECEALIRGEARGARAFAELHFGLARAFADFVRRIFPEAAAVRLADLAAFPGQTLYHAPGGEHGFSFQIGSPAAFATFTGLPTVGEFRLPDVLGGGQGAPLAPLADALLRRDEGEYRAILNLGGIANITLLPPGRGTDGVRAWDTGPANTLLDATARLAWGKSRDEGGCAAARGRVAEERLRSWLAHPWFAQRPPKSTGRELFGGELLGQAALAAELRSLGAEDLLASLVELTVIPVVEALADAPIDRLFVTGGGCRNARLMERLREALAPLAVETIDSLGTPSAAKEAVDFALLALEAAAGRPVSLPAVTGAERAAGAGLFSCGGRGGGVLHCGEDTSLAQAGEWSS
jgi:anhydro-N-acetylmuramic acid kinase